MLCGGTAINTFDELLNSDYDSNLIGFVKRERCSLGGCAPGYWLGDPASAAAHGQMLLDRNITEFLGAAA